MEDFIELASTQGMWSALSIILIFYILKCKKKEI